MLYLNGIVSKPCPLRDPLTLPLACWWPFLVRIFKPESDWKVFGREVWRGVWQIHTRFKRSWLHIINRLMKNSVNSLAPSWLMVYVSMGWGWGWGWCTSGSVNLNLARFWENFEKSFWKCASFFFSLPKKSKNSIFRSSRIGVLKVPKHSHPNPTYW